MSPGAKKDAHGRVVRNLFGAPLQQQGRGYYVTLELLAIAWGVNNVGDASTELLDPRPELGSVTFTRRAHDFVRRLLHDPSATFVNPHNAAAGGTPPPEVLEPVSSLLAGLTVPVPFLQRPKWHTTHLFPYSGDLIHYDAVERAGNPRLERNNYRGGGLLAYDLLRLDPDPQRRTRNARGMSALVKESDTAVGRLVMSLQRFDSLPPLDATEDFVADGRERRESHLVEELRSGVDRILASQIEHARKVQHLMHFVPFVLALQQRHLAYQECSEALDLMPSALPAILLAFAPDPTMRSLSRFELNATRRVITEAMRSAVKRLAKEGALTNEMAHILQADSDAAWAERPANFFTATMAAVGALNANAGLRHFVLRPAMLEAIVAATVDGSLPFEDFTDDILFSRFGLAATTRSCGKAQFHSPLDGGRAERNERELERLMGACDLLDRMSDSSSLVRIPRDGSIE